MNEQEKENWEKHKGLAESKLLSDPVLEHLILAADAELKRLREAVEWALENGDVVTIFGSDEPRGNWKDELRRRAGEK